MRTTFIFTFLLLLTIPAFAQNYKRVRVFTGEEGLKKLGQAGVTTDHGLHKKGVFFESDFSENELQAIEQLGFKYSILIDDVKAEYKRTDRKITSPAASSCQQPGATSILTPAGFSLGSMGGFYTYTEMLAELDSMKARFPNLISVKAPADLTPSIEGRPIYYVRISDNASTDEAEPEMLYTALHHAREPAGMQQMIYYMYYLLENYSTDLQIQYLLNNTELYFIPCVNPDGYIYNETTDPTGGGMWRKNRRNNGNGTYGIDLNRNYGYAWGYDNTGSSPNSSSDTYRGTSGFSEPETQVIRNFVNGHDFKIAINYHTYGNFLIYPWGFNNTYTPDSAIFKDYSTLLVKDNNYMAGTALQTVGYVANGGSDDWLYGDTTAKPKIFGFTPEAGDPAEGFWPASFLIEDICKGNVTMNLNAALLMLKHASVTDQERPFITQATGYLNYSIKRLGLEPGAYTVSIIPLDSSFISIGAPKNHSNLQLLESQNDSISFTLGSVTYGQTIRYVLSLNNGSITINDTLIKYYGQPAIAFTSTGNSVAIFSTTGWGTTSEAFVSSSTSITDSPFSTYNSNTNNYITTPAISLSNVSVAKLSFYAKWEIEADWDYAQVQVSIDNGISWTPLCGKYTKPGNQPVYDGVQTQWVKEEIDLSSYINQTIKLRFGMISDGFVEMDGFYFDDLIVETISSSPASLTDATGVTVEIYPNPAKDQLAINCNARNYNIRMYNGLGMLVKNERATGKSILNVESLSDGIYFIEISSGNELVRRKVVIGN